MMNAHENVKGVDVLLKMINDDDLKLELYRFVIDGLKQKDECVETWEKREKGSLQAMFQGLLHIVQEIKKNNQNIASLAFLQKLHEIATSEVKFFQEVKSGKLKKEDITCELIFSEQTTYATTTQQGLTELIKMKNEGFPYDHAIHFDRLTPYIGLILKNENDKEKLSEIINQIFSDYAKKIALAENDDAKLDVIIDCIRRLEIIHPFADANCRTICVLMLNTLLMANNFSPVILLNPNRFDGFSHQELKDDILNGFENTTALLNKHKIPFNDDSDENFQLFLNSMPLTYAQNDKKILAEIFNSIFESGAFLIEDFMENVTNKSKINHNFF